MGPEQEADRQLAADWAQDVLGIKVSPRRPFEPGTMPEIPRGSHIPSLTDSQVLGETGGFDLSEAEIAQRRFDAGDPQW